MRVVLLTWLTACGAPDGAIAPAPDATGVPAADATHTPAAPPPTEDAGSAGPGSAGRPGSGAAEVGPGGLRVVEMLLDRGHFEDDAWVSEPVGTDELLLPLGPAVGGAEGAEGRGAAAGGAPGTLARVRRILPPGDGVAQIRRAGCGTVDVPYSVGIDTTVVLPYPGCAAPDAPPVPGLPTRLARRELAWADVARIQQIGLFAEIPPAPPGEEDGPARYLTLAEARGLCAWQGGRLPSHAEWAAARARAKGTPIADAGRLRNGSAPLGETARAVAGLESERGPNGHEDLDGNVEEWLDDGTVAGGSFVSLPDELGVVRMVPANARSETIGVRCAWEGAGR